MRKIQTISVVMALLFSLTVSAQNNESAKGTNKLATLPRDLEIQLALSALPPHLRDNATVYVLNPDLHSEVRQSHRTSRCRYNLLPAHHVPLGSEAPHSDPSKHKFVGSP